MVEAIGRLGSATEAAAELSVSQPAVSHALTGLEGRLGVELFRREHAGMRPTPEGERLIRAARIVLREIGAAEEDIARLAGGAGGTIRIATECYTCYHWLPGVLRRFHDDLGHEEVDVVPLALDDPMEAVVRGTVDVAVGHSPPPSPDVRVHELFTDELVLVVPPGHALSSRPWVDPSLVVRRFLGPANVTPARTIELRLTEAVLSGVRAGMGVASLASWAVAPEVSRGELDVARLGRRGIFRTWYAVTPAGAEARRPLEALVRLLRDDALGTLAWPEGRGPARRDGSRRRVPE